MTQRATFKENEHASALSDTATLCVAVLSEQDSQSFPIYWLLIANDALQEGGSVPDNMVKDIDTALFKEFFRALSTKSGMNLHIQLLKAEEVHHAFEAVFKAFAKALEQAVSYDSRIRGVLSTKGTLE
jgi:hypothetical protein